MPSVDITELVTALVDQVAHEQSALIEEFCERSLTDPAGRGVLILWDEYPWSFSIALSETVPWAEIHEVIP